MESESTKRKGPDRKYWFKPGQSGNPGGKPKQGRHLSLRGTLRYMLKQKPPSWMITTLRDRGFLTDTDITKIKNAGEAIVYVMFQAALEGDTGAVYKMFEYTEPPLKQTVALESEDGGPIQFILPPLPNLTADAPADPPASKSSPEKASPGNKPKPKARVVRRCKST